MFVFRAPFYLVFVTVSRAFYVFNMINESFQVKQVPQGHFGPDERKQCKTSRKRQEIRADGFVLSARRDMPRRKKPPTASASFWPPFWPEERRRRKSSGVFDQQRRVQTLGQARHKPPRQSRRPQRRVQTLKSARWNPPNKVVGEFMQESRRNQSRRTSSHERYLHNGGFMWRVQNRRTNPPTTPRRLQVDPIRPKTNEMNPFCHRGERSRFSTSFYAEKICIFLLDILTKLHCKRYM